jgi:hypothetical protein
MIALIFVWNANVWGVTKYHDFLRKTNQSGSLQKNNFEKLKIRMHPQLINMDLQEGMVIKNI